MPTACEEEVPNVVTVETGKGQARAAPADGAANPAVSVGGGDWPMLRPSSWPLIHPQG